MINLVSIYDEILKNQLKINSDGSVNVIQYITDEYNISNTILGDNIFRGAQIAITPEHHEIHCGDSYEMSTIGDLGNGGVIDIIIIVPDEGVIDGDNTGLDQTIKQYHFQGTIETESESTVEFYEGVKVSANGTLLDVFNRNRNSTNADELLMYSDATVIDTGTRLAIHKIGSGRATGGMQSRSDEFILKNDSIYLLRITNNVTTNNYYDVYLNYYVHPGV